MSVSKKTEFGTITLSNQIFAAFIRDAFGSEDCNGKIWPASRRGRQIGNSNKIGLNELNNSVEAVSAESCDVINMEINVIIKFGTSIKKITKKLSDNIAEIMLNRYGRKPNQIKINIVGIKSKQIAKRNLEVVYCYGA